MSPEVLNLILQALDANGEAVFGREDIAAWPKEDFDEALRTGLLEEAAPADEVECPGCDEACLEDVEFIYGDAPADTRAYVACYRFGRYRIPLDLLDRWAVNRQKANELRPPSRVTAAGKFVGRAKSKKPKASAAQNRLLLLHFLLAHHRSDTDEPNWKLASEDEIAKTMHWSQPTVSRAMKALFGKAPMNMYRRLCSQEMIAGFLKKQDDGSHDVDAPDPHSVIH
jgi:hypothetical protein